MDSSTAKKTRDPHSVYVTREQYGAKWPFTVSAGTLSCDAYDGTTFTSDDGRTYWINGLAANEAHQYGWSDSREIQIPGTDIDPIFFRADDLC